MHEERRITAGDLRAEPGESGFAPTLRGYAIVYHSLSEDLGGFREIIHPDAVKRTFAESIDLRAFVDHDPARIIGRLSAGTLRAKSDSRGLAVEIDLPNTTVGRDLAVSVSRRDISGMSFAFRVMPDGDKWERVGNNIVRTVFDARISECSVVSTPAYAETTAAIRSLERFKAGEGGRSLGTLSRRLRQQMVGWR